MTVDAPGASGATEPGLRTTRTRRALTAAHEAGLLGGDDAQTLDKARVLATRCATR